MVIPLHFSLPYVLSVGKKGSHCGCLLFPTSSNYKEYIVIEKDIFQLRLCQGVIMKKGHY